MDPIELVFLQYLRGLRSYLFWIPMICWYQMERGTTQSIAGIIKLDPFGVNQTMQDFP